MQLRTLIELIAEVQQRVPDRRILLFGSSSLLASFPDEVPAAIGVELTLDADFFLDPDEALIREMLTDIFGRNQAYHIANGHYGDFVDLRLSEQFPEGWRTRLVPVPGFAEVFALDPVDVAVTKVMATARSRWAIRMGRSGVDRGDKDINTIVALLKGGWLNRAVLEERLSGLDREPTLVVESAQVLREIGRLVAEGRRAASDIIH